LYESSAVEARFSNRSAPLVMGELDTWWANAKAFEASEHGRDSFAETQLDLVPETPTQEQVLLPRRLRDTVLQTKRLPGGDHSLIAATTQSALERRTKLHRNAYAAVFMRVMKTLQEPDEMWDADEAAALVNEAWVNDARGSASRILRSQFCDAVFELADIWTRGVAAEEVLSLPSHLISSLIASHLYRISTASLSHLIARKQRSATTHPYEGTVTPAPLAVCRLSTVRARIHRLHQRRRAFRHGRNQSLEPGS
jgi:hypothetical protein